MLTAAGAPGTTTGSSLWQVLAPDSKLNSQLGGSPWTTPAMLSAHTTTAAIKASGFATDAGVSAYVTLVGAPGTTSGVSLYTPLETVASATARTNAIAGASLPATIDITRIDNTDISNSTIYGSTITSSTVVAGTSVWIVNTASAEAVTANMMGGNPVGVTAATVAKVFNLPTLTAGNATPFYLFCDPVGAGVSVVVPAGAGSSIYVYDPVKGLPRYVGGQTLFAHLGGGPGQQVSLNTMYSAASGWFYNVLGLTGVSWSMQTPTGQKGKTWIGCQE
jgi:hypothetical protein